MDGTDLSSLASLPSEDRAEWAVRWDATETSKTLAEIAAALGCGDKEQKYLVSYARPEAPPTPPGYRWIVRRRERPGKEIKLTYKLRGPGPIMGWKPPFEGSDDLDEEWDLTLGTHGVLTPAYSHSASTSDQSPPVGWTLPDWTAPVSMRRFKAEKDTVEEWLVGGRRYLEISRRSNVGAGEEFSAWVAEVIHGATLLEAGMTNLVLTMPA